jgi:hypothetical protein
LQNSLQTTIAADQILERDHVQLSVKRFHRAFDEALQPTGFSQWTRVVFSRKAFGKGYAGFEYAKDISNAYLAWRDSKPQTSGAATQCLDETMLLQLVYNMPQMVARCVAGPGDVGRFDKLAFVNRTEHQDTGGKIGSDCQAHGVVPVSLVERQNRSH